MHYKTAYLHLFNRLTEIIGLVESIDVATEQVDVAQLLRQLQAESEAICIK